MVELCWHERRSVTHAGYRLVYTCLDCDHQWYGRPPAGFAVTLCEYLRRRQREHL